MILLSYNLWLYLGDRDESFCITGIPGILAPDTSDCKIFYHCDVPSSSVMRCPQKLVFDVEKQYCDYEDKVPRCAGSYPSPVNGNRNKNTLVY